jgi:hypothetical protein
MKILYGSILSMVLLVGCASPEKLMMQGNYDAIIDK